MYICLHYLLRHICAFVFLLLCFSVVEVCLCRSYYRIFLLILTINCLHNMNFEFVVISDFDDVNYTCKTDVKLKECDIKCDFKKKLNTIIDKENIRDSCEQCQNLQQMYVRGSMESNGICFCKSQDFILSLQRMPHGEKRKFSNRHYNRLKHASLSGNFSCDSSSDDEVKDLCAKYKCISSSPPINELFNKSATQDNPGLFCVERIPSRPSLDLEKMQQVSFFVVFFKGVFFSF